MRRHTAIAAIVWITVSILANTGCGASGLQRTELNDWELKELQYLGVRLEVPVDAYSIVNIPGEGEIQMHPYFPPKLVVDEPRCILDIRLFRLSEEERLADLRMNSGGAGSDEDSRKYWEWYYSAHDLVGRYDKGAYAYFRYDLKCADGTTLMITAELMTTAEGMMPEYIREDEAAIRRILESAECIEPKPMPKIEKGTVFTSSFVSSYLG